MQHPGNGLYMASSAPSSVAPSVAGSAYSPTNSVQHAQPTMRHPLPNRNVDINSIEEAYVSFVLACNPAVPSGADTAALREAFQTPPRSDGRSFSIYMLYLLIRELEDRIIKTWAELALKLGVEPPDQEKGQSSQKIQQYAVRLKRWMHSMHVDAFFDYLMGRSHPYWTEIPPDNYPISELLRDGVAAKDDMALRALIPEIKPRRGRKRDDESDSDYTGNRDPQRQRLDNYTDEMGRWAGGQNAGGIFGYPSNQQQLSPDGTMRASPPWAGSTDSMSTPMSHGGFWGEDSKPAVAASSTSSGRRPGRRHGAKVVSSAWRSNGSGGSGKTRGRPPINRSGNHHALPPSQDGSFPPVSVIEQTTPPFPPQTTSTYLPHMESSATISPLPPSAVTTSLPDLNAAPAMSSVGGPSGILPPPIPQSAYPGATDSPRSSQSNHASLQVPDRKGDVHLPPPHMQGLHSTVMPGGSGMGMHVQGIAHTVNPTVTNITLNSYGTNQLGMPPNMSFVPSELLHSQHPHHMGGSHSPMGMHPMTATTDAPSVTSETAPSYTSEPIIDSTHKPGEGKNARKEPIKPPPMYQSRFGSGSPNDRTNIDELEAFFMTEMFAATWYDENDNKITPCSVEEASALVKIIINDLTKAAASKEAFLINLAALAGGKILMANTNVCVKRLETTAEYTKYDCRWELRYGDVRGQFSIQEAVPHAHWKKLTNEVKAAVARAIGLVGESSTSTARQPPIPPAPSQDQSFGSSGFSFLNTAQFASAGRPNNPVASSASEQSIGVHEQSDAAYVPPLNFGLPATGAHVSTGGGVGGVNMGTPGGSAGGPSTRSAVSMSEENTALAALWERKYRHLLHLLYKRDQQLDRTRASVLRGLQDTYRDDDSFNI
ncbi:ars-binding protein [Ophiostoma piceae UAMH 11346]|uniref:Ars-binding protein n=1 Tax=Ophiostoma piceae (strain UAMH 11346) TaxID=1262450 RepID=S3BR78_OPHP1|nr:ars-binding protein [Ophiostoma piceae UAMH 11346]